MRNLPSPTSITPATTGPVQYSEPLPPWLELELAGGRDKIPQLRAALCRAQLKCKGVLAQTSKNEEQGYTYTGFSDVLDAVRTAMAEEGISVDQVTCDIEEELHYQTYKGARTIWKWRAVCLVTHVEGGTLVRVIRPITSPGEKAPFIARTGADRTLLMTLMRIAGAKDDSSTPEEREARSWRGGPREAPQREMRRPERAPPAAVEQQQPAEAPRVSAELLAKHQQFTATALARIEAATTKARMVTVARMISARALPPDLYASAFDAWKARCAVLGLVVKELQQDVRRKGPLPEERVHVDEAGDMSDRENGELL